MVSMLWMYFKYKLETHISIHDESCELFKFLMEMLK